MKASIYYNPFDRVTLIDDNVEITSISPLPKLKKNGELSKSKKSLEQIRLETLYLKGIRVADVVYSDGTRGNNVWVNMKDIREVE